MPWLFFLFSSVSLVLKATLLGLGKIVVWVQMFSFKNVTLKNDEYGVVAVSFWRYNRVHRALLPKGHLA